MNNIQSTVFTLIFTFSSLLALAESGNDARKSESTNADGTKIVSLLDDKGNPRQASLYNADGSLRQKTTYKRNEDGLLLEAVISDATGKLKLTETYAYDPKGRNVSIRRTDDKGWVYTMTVLYDEQGNSSGAHYLNRDGAEMNVAGWDALVK